MTIFDDNFQIFGIFPDFLKKFPIFWRKKIRFSEKNQIFERVEFLDLLSTQKSFYQVSLGSDLMVPSLSVTEWRFWTQYQLIIIFLSRQRWEKFQFGPRGNSSLLNKVFSLRLLTSCTFKTFLRSIKVLGKLFNKSTNLSKIISASFLITDRTEGTVIWKKGKRLRNLTFRNLKCTPYNALQC